LHVFYTRPLYAILPPFKAALFAGKEISRSTLPANLHTTGVIKNALFRASVESFCVFYHN